MVLRDIRAEVIHDRARRTGGSMIIFHPVPSGARLLCMSFTSLCMSFTSTLPEIAEVMKVSLATAKRHWTYARTWLFAELKDRGNSRKLENFLKRNEGFRARLSR
jgi:hypothetical protein